MFNDIYNDAYYSQTTDDTTFKKEAPGLLSNIAVEIEKMVCEPEKNNLNDNEVKVGVALIELLNNWEEIFADVRFSPEDRFLDVGCGKGRVLAFLIKQRCPCMIYGVEYNAEVGKIAAEWTKRYERVKVMIGDAFQIDYNSYTILGLARSFLPKTFLSFVETLEKTLTHPITLVSWYDQLGGHLLKDRPGWELQKSGVLDRIRGIKVASFRQTYSIWVYDPQRMEAVSGEKAKRAEV